MFNSRNRSDDNIRRNSYLGSKENNHCTNQQINTNHKILHSFRWLGIHCRYLPLGIALNNFESYGLARTILLTDLVDVDRFRLLKLGAPTFKHMLENLGIEGNRLEGNDPHQLLLPPLQQGPIGKSFMPNDWVILPCRCNSFQGWPAILHSERLSRPSHVRLQRAR